MKRLALLVLLFCASSAQAATVALQAEPKALPPVSFSDEGGHRIGPEAFKGKVVVLNYWATWCAPCRAEFPQLDSLEERLSPRGLVVVPVSVDHGAKKAVDRFYQEMNVAHLGKYLDPESEGVRALNLRGLPTTLILNREGREVARIEGAPNWDGKEMSKLFDGLLKEQPKP